MNRDQTLAKLKEILGGKDFLVEADQITPTADLREDLGLDSLDIVELAMNIEDTGDGLMAPDEDWKTVGDVLKWMTSAGDKQLAKAKGKP